MRKYFGTDGVRGVANKELTCDLAYKLGRAGGYVLANNEYKVKVVVGRDTRQSGDMLEAALIAGLMSVGCDVITVGVIPTPGVAYLTRKYGAECGVVISASHNPMEDNGIKFFNKDGFKLDDQIELKIEEYIDNIEKIDYNPIGNEVGIKIHKHTATQDYVDYLKSIVNTDLTGLKVVLDCANGAAYKVAPMVFKELGAEVIAMNITPNGENINHECGSTHPEGLKKAVIEHKADLGLAGMTVTDERKQSVDFTDSYATGIQSVIVKEGSSIKSIDDLKGKKIGVQLATTGDIYAKDDFGEENVEEYNKGADAVMALTSGKIDAVIIDNQPAKSFVETTDGLQILDTDYVQEDYAAAIQKGNTDLLNAVNGALKELKEDGTIQKILDKYIK